VPETEQELREMHRQRYAVYVDKKGYIPAVLIAGRKP
jgi:hypothetical protein